MGTCVLANELTDLCTHTCNHTHQQTGYYKGHGFKYLIVVSPCGIIEEIAGPYPARLHDSDLVRAARLEQRLSQFCIHHGEDYKLYGDPAFAKSRFIEKPFQRTVAAATDLVYNTAMSHVRVTVEQAIGHVTQHFSAMDFVRTERPGNGEVGKKYLVACFLKNVLTCVREGNQVSEYFGCKPPSLRVFLDERDVRDPLPPRLEEMGEFEPRDPDDDD